MLNTNENLSWSLSNKRRNGCWGSNLLRERAKWISIFNTYIINWLMTENPIDGCFDYIGLKDIILRVIYNQNIYKRKLMIILVPFWTIQTGANTHLFIEYKWVLVNSNDKFNLLLILLFMSPWRQENKFLIEPTKTNFHLLIGAAVASIHPRHKICQKSLICIN